MGLSVNVNGKDFDFEGGDLTTLLSTYGLKMEQGGIAVAVNSSIVPRSEWKLTKIFPEDKVEIVQIVRGG